MLCSAFWMIRVKTALVHCDDESRALASVEMRESSRRVARTRQQAEASNEGWGGWNPGVGLKSEDKEWRTRDVDKRGGHDQFSLPLSATVTVRVSRQKMLLTCTATVKMFRWDDDKRPVPSPLGTPRA